MGEILKGIAAILWPILLAVCLWGFRAEFRTLFSRLRSLGIKGAEFDESRLAAQIAAVPVEQALKEAAPLEEHPPLVIARVGELSRELDTLHKNSDANRISLLLLRLAEAQQVQDFQFVWLNIFLSQLEALEGMRASGGAISLEPYFEAHLQRYSAISAAREGTSPPVNFGGWTGFLVRSSLATVTERQGGLSPKGLALLTFATSSNLPRYQGL